MAHAPATVFVEFRLHTLVKGRGVPRACTNGAGEACAAVAQGTPSYILRRDTRQASLPLGLATVLVETLQALALCGGALAALEEFQLTTRGGRVEGVALCNRDSQGVEFEHGRGQHGQEFFLEALGTHIATRDDFERVESGLRAQREQGLHGQAWTMRERDLAAAALAPHDQARGVLVVEGRASINLYGLKEPRRSEDLGAPKCASGADCDDAPCVWREARKPQREGLVSAHGGRSCRVRTPRLGPFCRLVDSLTRGLGSQS